MREISLLNFLSCISHKYCRLLMQSMPWNLYICLAALYTKFKQRPLPSISKVFADESWLGWTVVCAVVVPCDDPFVVILFNVALNLLPWLTF